MAFCGRNTIFVRRLSPQVTETAMRQTFAQCDAIERLLFRSFPGRTAEIYAQVDFKTSKGVLEGHKMSGSSILGVPCEITLRDPGAQDTIDSIFRSQEPTLALEDVDTPKEPQGVQLEYMRKFKESVEEKRLRTLHVAGLKKGVTEENVRAICTSFGVVEKLRLDEDDQGEPFALVEYKEKGPATAVKLNQRFLVDGRVLIFTESKTLIDTCSFAEQHVRFDNAAALDPTNVKALAAFQNYLEPKLAKARQAAAEIAKEPVPAAVEEALAGKPDLETDQRKRDDRAHRSSARERRSGRRRSERQRRRENSRASRESEGSRGPRRGRRRPRRAMEGSQSRSQSRARRRRKAPASVPGSNRLCCAAEVPESKPGEESAIHLADDDELAVVPNTELLVLGESDSYSSEGDGSPSRAGPRVKIVVSTAVEEEAGTEAAAPAAFGLRSAGEVVISSVCAEDAEQLEGKTCASTTGETCAERVVSTVALAAGPRPGAPTGADEPAQTAARPAEETGGARGAAKVPAEKTEARQTPVASVPVVMTAPEQAGDVALSRWDCAVCGEANKSSRTHCNNCSTAAPWVRRAEKEAASSDESVSPPSTPRSVAESLPGSVKDVADSPARSVAGSSGHCVSESPERRIRRDLREPGEIFRLDDDTALPGDVVDVELESDGEDVKIQEDCELEATRLRGEIADARARIFHTT